MFGDTAPIYDETIEDLGRVNDQPVLPFNAYGTLAWARQEFENNSASSQVGSCGDFEAAACLDAAYVRAAEMVVLPARHLSAASFHMELFSKVADADVAQVFFLLKESELTPSGSNLLDGRFAVFGYVISGQDFLGNMKVILARLQSSRSSPQHLSPCAYFKGFAYFAGGRRHRVRQGCGGWREPRECLESTQPGS